MNELTTTHRPNQRRTSHHGIALAIASCLATLPGLASATEFTGENWTVDISGYINAYYTTVNCTGDAVGGTALAGRGLGCGGEDRRTTIGNGLLPNALITKATTQQGGIDITGQIAIMAHTATSDSLSPNSGVDVRQAFFTLGTPEFGTVKLGRDYGIFGANAILTDMTLLGVGAPVQATQRGRVALGHIGAGYAYLGSFGQIVYTSPGTSGVSFTGGVFSPSDVAGVYNARSAPQVQAQVSYTAGGFKGWVGAKTQNFYAPDDSGITPDNFTMSAGEAGISYKGGKFTALANVQAGKGIGILTEGDQGDTKGLHYLLQGTYAVTDKVKLGLSGGVSKNRDETVFTGGLESNKNLTGGAYYQLTKSVTLAFELSQTRSEDFDGNTAKMNGVSVGGILFF